MTESPQSEILNNSMLKIPYKHESLIFFCSKKNKTIPFSQIYCNARELNACLFEVLSESFTFPNLYSLHMRHFSQFRGLLPYSQNTALKRKCKVSFVLCFVLKILFEKKRKKLFTVNCQ